MRYRPLALLLLTLCVPATFFVTACGKRKAAGVMGPEGVAGPEGAAGLEGAALKVKSTVTICHVDELGNAKVLTINEKAWPGHAAHGDLQLVDADGDGWVQAVNACVPGGDCDDQDPTVHPGAVELCDAVDNDCDGQRIEGSFVFGTQTSNILRDNPARLRESAMGNLVADAMRLKYSGVDGAITNSGGLRNDLLIAPPTSGENPGEITCEELFSVLPFGNRIVILTLTGAQLEQAFLNGLSPACNPAVTTGRTPQISGLKVTFSCNGTTPVINGMWKTPQGIGGPQIPIGPTDTVRLVTNDFLAGGGDGYSVFQQGTNIVRPGDTLLQVLIDYVSSHSPVSSAVQGRIVVGGAAAF